MDNENLKNMDDSAVKMVMEQKDQGNLIASFLLCSTFIEHYCKTKLFIDIIERRPVELIKIKDKNTQEWRKVFITNKLEKIIWEEFTQRQILDIGLLVGAWNKELYDQLTKFNSERNKLIHKYQDLLKILEKDEKKVTNTIKLGVSLLPNIKRGYVEK